MAFSEVPYPLRWLHHIVVKQLYFLRQPGTRINPLNWHYKTIVVAMKSCISIGMSGPENFSMVVDSQKRQIAHHWGDRLRFVRFDLAVIEYCTY
jgi:hypothetical protein